MTQQSNKRTSIAVRLALTAEEVKELGSHERSVPAEILRRLRGGQVSPTPSPFAGWPAADAADFNAMGDAVGQLFAQVTRLTGTNTPLKRRLGYLRPALMAMLDGLGAEDAKPEDEKFFAGIAHGLLRDCGAMGVIFAGGNQD